MKKFLKKRWYFFVIVLLIVGFFYYRNRVLTQTANKENSFTVIRTNLKNILTLSGQLSADEQVALRFQTSGRLNWVGVKVGDHVKKYQEIASLDQRDLKNRLTKYLNTYSEQRNNFDSAVEDSNVQSGLSQPIRDDAERVLENNQYDLNNAVLDVEYQNLLLEYANLYTPIEGIVTNVDSPYPGVNISPAGAEFDIVNPKTLYFSASADQTDVVNLKEGMTGDISFDAYPDKIFKGKLYFIGFTPETNETGTVYETRFRLDEATMKLPLKMGMTADVDINLQEEDNVLAIPTAFLNHDRKGSYVTVKINNLKTKRYVEVGDEINGNQVIKNGLSAGDVIYD